MTASLRHHAETRPTACLAHDLLHRDVLPRVGRRGLSSSHLLPGWVQLSACLDRVAHGRDRDRTRGGYARDAVRGSGGNEHRSVGAVSSLCLQLRNLGHLLLRLAVGLSGLATVVADLGSPVSDSGTVDRPGARAGRREREPRRGVAAAAQPPTAGTTTPLLCPTVGASGDRRCVGAALIHARLSGGPGAGAPAAVPLVAL